MIFFISPSDDDFFSDVMEYLSYQDTCVFVNFDSEGKAKNVILPGEIDDILNEEQIKRFTNLYKKYATDNRKDFSATVRVI